jgi:DNA-binding GntR family transcriptional regulator
MKRATGGSHVLNRRPELFVPPIVLDAETSVPLHRQIYRQIAHALHSNAIPYEARLPSTRAMARLLRVSRNTVVAAYDDLAADDVVRPERGVGMRINRSALQPRVTWFGLRQVIRAAGYPSRGLEVADTDGNPLHIRF